MRRRAAPGRTLLLTVSLSAVFFTALAFGLKRSVLAGKGHPGADDLPLVEYPAVGGAGGDLMAVVMSGDGGWSPVDVAIGRALSRRGIPVVGWNSLRYYWHPRSPQEASEDLQRIVDAYAARWGKPRVLVVGVSFGADALPFLVNRLPPEEKGRVAGVALLSFGRDAAFEFHVRDWLNARPPTRWHTVPEVRRLNGMPLLCIYGTNDDVTRVGCPLLKSMRAKIVEMPGGHQFGGAYGQVARMVVPARQPAAGWEAYAVRAKVP